jgi:hypothetical protein
LSHRSANTHSHTHRKSVLRDKIAQIRGKFDVEWKSRHQKITEHKRLRYTFSKGLPPTPEIATALLKLRMAALVVMSRLHACASHVTGALMGFRTTARTSRTFCLATFLDRHLNTRSASMISSISTALRFGALGKCFVHFLCRNCNEMQSPT